MVLSKGSRVEVSSDDAGFQGAWYVATLLDNVNVQESKSKGSKHKSKRRKKIGYIVKYDSLFQECNLSEHLMEIVDPSFVRPLPPRYPRRNNEVAEAEAEAEEVGCDFELFDVVDAYHLDGWWIGVVTKVMIDGEFKKYIVSFESPPEEVEFEKSELRLHVDWIDGRWQVPPKKTLEHQSAVINAAETPKSNDDAHSGFTAPSEGAIMTDPDNPTVGPQISAKKKSGSQKIAVAHGETVGGPDLSVTYNRNKRGERNSHGKRFQSSAGSKGNTEVVVPLLGASGSKAIHQDSLLFEQEISITETCEAESGKIPQKRKRGRPPRSLIKMPNDLLQDNQESGERVSSVIHEMTTELDEQPLSVWYQGLHPMKVMKNTAIVNNREITKYQQEWPFTKQSPIWATIESLELYQNSPQKPHFSLLKKVKEDYREGFAIAHMVTFANVVQRTSKLKLDDANDLLENSLKTVGDLETHGFDVGAVRARLNELLSRKAQVGELKDKLKQVETELEKQNVEKSKIDEQINQLEGEMQELQEKLVESVKKKNVKDEEIMMLQSNLHLVGNQIMDLKVDFEKLAATPL
ncbi:Agenet-like domain-containing protein [Cynara cardunculus var. scolymus]|uniref:Agenet-like domain-containing protein n=1 Tax=Cynara cardunculus var. scolymus TaxID=59895 RepID=A0A103Y198_CYNCS|nr:Agenet-like domain-containing protein [Cynara cardunculus var. scolymus]